MTTDGFLSTAVLLAVFVLFARGTTRLAVVLGWLELAETPAVVRALCAGVRAVDDDGRRPFVQLGIELALSVVLIGAVVYALRPSSPYGDVERQLMCALLAGELVWGTLLAIAVGRRRHR